MNLEGQKRKMKAQTEEERKLAELIIECLNLEDVAAEDIGPDEPLFGEGLGLDSIDALELALAITQNYAVQLKADDKNMKQAFGTLSSLNEFIMENAS